ncbi:C40 family peptidase [Ramlibacter sp. MMS24-I3-19]|uniref:C40 family peptidase n=1 Tax=Ramlibacter sp. MMS24-I3-19 TaxID=3416606 RepID=UPI003D00C3E4
MLLLRLLSTVALAAAMSAQAAPSQAPTSQEDDLQRFVADNGLMDRIGQVRSRIGTTTSELVVTAMGFLGVPYRRGGNSAETGGFDCSGFVKAIYEQTVGLVLPRRAEQQAAATQSVDKRDLQPGDLVFFNTMRRAFSHVGIYVGDGKFIHSPKPGAEVRVENMGANYWQRRFDGARRVLVSQQQAPLAGGEAGAQP